MGSSGNASLGMIKPDHIFRHFATIPTRLIHFAAATSSARLRRRHRLTRCMDTPPIQPFKSRQLRDRQMHHAVFDPRPAEDAILQSLGEQAQTSAVPEHQLDPVRPFRAEHIDRTRERIRRQALAHQCRQPVGALAEVYRLGRHHHPHRAGWAYHAPAFNARNTAAIVSAGAPAPMRTVAPSIATSIVPTSGSSRCCRRALRCRCPEAPAGAASTTAGTNRTSLSLEMTASASLTCRRQPNNCCGDNPCRRATPETESPLLSISATTRALSSSLQVRRRPAPVKTSSRRAGLVIALSTVSILSLTVKAQAADSQIKTSAGR